MSEPNPYQPPASRVADGADSAQHQLATMRRVPAGHALAWLKEGIRLLSLSPGKWLAIGGLYFLLSVALQMVPVVGPTLAQIAAVLVFGGLLQGCSRLDRGGALSVKDFLGGVTHLLQPLLMLGLAYIAALASAALMALFAFGEPAFRFVAFGEQAEFQPTPLMFIAIYAAASLVGMFFTFAPPLAVFNALDPMPALKASIAACSLNFSACVLFVVIELALLWLGLMSFGLLFIVIGPLLMTATYAAYKDVFAFNPATA